MATVKTAISLDEALFEQTEYLARSMKISRSRLFVLALENFVRQHQDRQLFEEINRAYEDSAVDESERQRLLQLRRQHRHMVEGEW